MHAATINTIISTTYGTFSLFRYRRDWENLGRGEKSVFEVQALLVTLSYM
jgi:hypothetical protein